MILNSVLLHTLIQEVYKALSNNGVPRACKQFVISLFAVFQ